MGVCGKKEVRRQKERRGGGFCSATVDCDRTMVEIGRAAIRMTKLVIIDCNREEGKRRREERDVRRGRERRKKRGRWRGREGDGEEKRGI